MSWRGFIRSVNAASARSAKVAGPEMRRRERAAASRHRELERIGKEAAKHNALENARIEVEANANAIDCLVSIHRDQGPVYNWQSIVNSPPPLTPVKQTLREQAARNSLERHDPGLMDRLSGHGSKERDRLTADLQRAMREEEIDYQRALAKYREELADWTEMCSLAKTVIAGDLTAYSEALTEINPFQEVAELGSSLEAKVHSSVLVEIRVFTKGERVIPAHLLTLSASGKVSRKAIPKARFNEILQDYICGSALRVGRETFALLPVQTVLVNIAAPLLNPSTGHVTNTTVLTVAFPRKQFLSLNFDLVDPSEAMINFLSRDCFRNRKRGVELTGVPPLDLKEINPPDRPPLVVTVSPVVAPALSPSPTIPRTAPAFTPPARNLLQDCWDKSNKALKVKREFVTLTANELADMVGGVRRDRFSPEQCRDLAEATELLGFCVEPDARFTAGSLAGGQNVGIFTIPGGTLRPPSTSYQGAAALLALVIMVATADPAQATEAGIVEFRRFLEMSFDFRSDEHLRLTILQGLFLASPNNAQTCLRTIQDRVPSHQRVHIAKLLVRIALLDGVLHPNEHGVLRTIFKALTLDELLLNSLIQAELPPPDATVTVVPPTPGKPSHPLPSTPPPSFQLDMSRVAAITQETSQVIAILAAALAEPSGSAPVEVPTSNPSTATATIIPAETETTLTRSVPKDRMQTLEPRLRPLVRSLILKPLWSKAEFHTLTERYDLMPLQAVDVINTWSDDALGDFLLQAETDVLVNFDILTTS